MSKPYDATGKELLQSDPVGWAAFLGVVRPPDRIELRDSELSTITAAADKVLVIKDDPPWLLDVEFQSWSDSGAPRQLLMYNGLLQEKHKVPVASVLVVLAPKAESSAYTGTFAVRPPFGPAWEFRFTVLKLWEMPVAPFLTGPLAILPLAPLADLSGVGLPAVAQQIGQRLRAEADLAAGDKVVTMLSVLMKLRYDAMTTKELLESIPDIEDYPGFKMFLDKGRREGRLAGRAEGQAEGRAEGRAEGQAEGRAGEARALVLRLGRKKFGPSTPEQEGTVNAITDIARLEALSEQLLDVATWDELLKAD